jgi:hypothetical protein
MRPHAFWSFGHWAFIRISGFGFLVYVPTFTFPSPARTLTSEMEQPVDPQLTIGSRVHVTQQIAARDYTWTSDIRGTIVDYSQKQTGSWYAHSKDDKLWLDRLTLRKDDGELITLNLDEYSHVELDPTPTSAPVTSPA